MDRSFNIQGFDRITVDPDQMGGQPCVRQMRLTVRRVLEAIATYQTVNSSSANIRDWKKKTFARSSNSLPQVSSTQPSTSASHERPPAGSRTAVLNRRPPQTSWDHRIHAADLGLSKASDLDILAYANEHRMIVVTLDADFHILLAASGAASPSAMRLRLQGKNGSQLADIIASALKVSEESLETGAVVSVTKTPVRVKLLPLKRRAESSL